jgi:multimeric flavodoxin WrbA
VGNGPKTCQYGGTGWGGDIGDIAEDDFGLETSMGTGLRVGSAAKLLSESRKLSVDVTEENTPETFTVGILITRDKDGYLQSTIENKIASIDAEGIEFNVINFAETFIQACIGCDVCPTPAKVEDFSDDGKDYKCIIDRDLDGERWRDDDLQDLHGELMRSDALLIGALDTNADGINDVYQALLERTRYIRRDDWRLHNVPLAAYVVTHPEKTTTYPMKIMTSWMRHNTLVHPPIVHTKLDVGAGAPIDQATAHELETHYNQGTIEQLDNFVRSAKRLRAASNITGPDKLSYKATGYQNKILDQTSAERT